MIKTRNLIITLLICMVMAISAASALAGKATCPDGSEPVRDGGTVSCTIVDPVGNSEASGGKSQTNDSSVTSNGTIKNEPQKEEDCSGPGNSPGNC